MKKYLLSASILLSVNVFAGGDMNKTIDTVGIQANTGYYFSIKGGLSTNCLFGVVYLPMSNDFGKGAYSMLLLAKSSGKQINIDYTQDSGGMCSLQKIDLL